METYEITVKYTPQGRAKPVEFQRNWERFLTTVNKTGGKVERWYGVQGEEDLLAIVSVPNPEDAAKCALVISTGGLATTHTHGLIPSDRFQEIMQEAEQLATSR
jgi:uncharacterized protein with GYD domain